MVSHFVDSVHLCYMPLLKKGVISFFLISTCMGCTNGCFIHVCYFTCLKIAPLGCTNVNVVLSLHCRSVGDARLQLKIIFKQRFSERLTIAEGSSY